MYIPVHIPEYNIYDIYHNDNNKIVIISPSETEPLYIKFENNIFHINICPHNHTYIYVLENEVEYKENISICINDIIVKTKVNKYPIFKDEIIMSTMVHNEDNYIRQWIKFHTNIGISRFIIYDNSKMDDKKSYKSQEKSSDLKNILNDYITNGTVVLINWNYPKRLNRSGISGQTTQQNHSIWAFQNCKYIGLFDIDEYINIQNDTDNNIHSFFTNLIQEQKINTNEIGSFRLLNKLFHNPHNLPTDNYNFLKIYNCDKITLSGREKNFVIPKNVSTYSVHMITKGKKMYNVSHDRMFFNHYFFLNKLDRGNNKTSYIDNSIYKHTLHLE